MEVIDVFKSGGPVMYALLLCSICTAVIMIERGMFYHRAGKNLGIFVDNLPDMLLNKSWNDAYADAAQEDNAAALWRRKAFVPRRKERICGWHWIRRTVRPPPNFEPI